MSFAQRLSFGIILAIIIAAGTLYYAWQRIESLTANIKDDILAERVIAASEKLLGQFISIYGVSRELKFLLLNLSSIKI
jgi:CHASE3 domain sensor protein